MLSAEARISFALQMALAYSQIDGAHHKAWVIDQMVRRLLGDDDEYKKWVEDACEGENGAPNVYDWDEGIPP